MSNGNNAAVDATPERASRRLERLFLVLALLSSCIAAVTIVTAFQEHRTIEVQRRVAASGRLVAEANALRESRPYMSLMLGIAALRLAPSAAARASLLATLSETHYAGVLAGQADKLTAAAFGNSGLLATASQDHTTILWDIRDHAHPRRLATVGGHTDRVEAVALSPDGDTLATGGTDKAVIIWNVTDPTRPSRLATVRASTGAFAEVSHVAFSPDGHTLAIGTLDNLTLWDVADRVRPTRLTTMDGGRTLAFSPSGRLLAADGPNDDLVLWDVGRRDHPVQLATITGHNDMTSIAFSPDGQTLAASNYDKTVGLWEIGPGRRPTRTATLPDQTSTVNSLAFSKDGRTLATGGDDKTATLWDVSDRKHPTRRAALTQSASSAVTRGGKAVGVLLACDDRVCEDMIGAGGRTPTG